MVALAALLAIALSGQAEAAGLSVKITGLPAVYRGIYASATVATKAGARGTIRVIYKSGASKAKGLSAKLVPPGTAVHMSADRVLDRVDRSGRLLRYLYRGSLNVNLKMVQDGAAAPYFYDGDRGLHAASLMSAAIAAKRAHRGLWGACPGTTVDPYRSIDTDMPR